MIFLHSGYKNIGGVENLILNLISNRPIYNFKNIKVVGSKDSYLYHQIAQNNLLCDFYDISEKSFLAEIEKDDIVVFFYYVDNFSVLKKVQSKAIIWNVLSDSIINWNRFDFEQKITKNKVLANYFTKKLIEYTVKNNSFFSMDQDSNEKIYNFIGKKIDIPYLPIPINHSDNLFLNKKITIQPKTINITYVGRGETMWKIYPIKKVVDDLSILKIDFVLHIFTDDSSNYKNLLSEFENKITYYYNFFGNRLSEKLLEVSDLHFGMGTSALEGGVIGIPTVLIDPSLSPVPAQYKYTWLYERKNYSLGKFITNEKSFPGHTIKEILQIFNDSNTVIDCSNLTYNYVIRNHSHEHLSSLIKNINSSASLKDILSYTPNSWNIADAVRSINKIFNHISSDKFYKL